MNDLKIIQDKIEAEWPGKSIYCFDSKGWLNDCGKVYAELLSRKKAEQFRESSNIFLCLVCSSRHTENVCPQCGANYIHLS